MILSDRVRVRGKGGGVWRRWVRLRVSIGS